MKKLLTFVFVIVTSSHNLFAQDTVYLKRNSNKASDKIIVTDRPPQAVFGELYGRSIIFSANYDRRLFKRLDGLGYTVGIGYADLDGLSIFSIPLTVNYLFGKHGKYLELGAGISYINASITTTDDLSSSTAEGHTIIGTMTIGYRSQPINGGFMFRAGINPLFFSNDFIPYPYVSFGYNF
jgi:hypothetical protein